MSEQQAKSNGKMRDRKSRPESDRPRMPTFPDPRVWPLKWDGGALDSGQPPQDGDAGNNHKKDSS